MNSNAIRSFEPVEPQSYLALAVRLSGASDEASRRSAIDRAYYAAFLTTRNELNDKGYIVAVQRSESHAQVVVALTLMSGTLGRRLELLRRARNRLTYQTDIANLPEGLSLEIMLDSARRVIEAVRALPRNPG